MKLPTIPEADLDKTTVKGVQLVQPLLEFSGACEGCGETPYVKLLTQLFGSRMVISNATGCSSIWAGTAGYNPYTTNKEGRGPAWANSLFEDNAEHGLGMAMAYFQRRRRVSNLINKALEPDSKASQALKDLLSSWNKNKDDAAICEKVS